MHDREQPLPVEPCNAHQAQAPPGRLTRCARNVRRLCLALALLSLLCLTAPAQVRTAEVDTAPPELATQALRPTPKASAVSAPTAWHTLSNHVFAIDYPSDWTPLSASGAAHLVSTALEGASPGHISHAVGLVGPSQDGTEATVLLLLALENSAYAGGITPLELQQAERSMRQHMGARLVALERVDIDGLPGLACTHLDATQSYVLRDVIFFPPEAGRGYFLCVSTPIACDAELEPIFRHMLSTLTVHREAAPATTVAPTATPTRELPKLLPALDAAF